MCHIIYIFLLGVVYNMFLVYIIMKLPTRKNVYLSHETIIRYNKRMRERQREKTQDITIKIPKKYKIIGVSVCLSSLIIPFTDIITIPCGVSVMQSTNRKQIIPNIIRNMKNMRKKISKTTNKIIIIIKYNKNGIKRQWK